MVGWWKRWLLCKHLFVQRSSYMLLIYWKWASVSFVCELNVEYTYTYGKFCYQIEIKFQYHIYLLEIQPRVNKNNDTLFNYCWISRTGFMNDCLISRAFFIFIHLNILIAPWHYNYVALKSPASMKDTPPKGHLSLYEML